MYMYMYTYIYICKYIYIYINLIRYSNRLPRPFRDRTRSVSASASPSARFGLEVFDAAQWGMMSDMSIVSQIPLLILLNPKKLSQMEFSPNS